MLSEATLDETPQPSPSFIQEPADTPIRQILSIAESTLPTTIACQGFATDLATGRLAWITTDAIFLIDEETHANLQHQIASELSAFTRERQLRQPRAHITKQPGWGGYGARILAWIWQAIAYFFGSGFAHRSHAALQPVCPQIETGCPHQIASELSELTRQRQLEQSCAYITRQFGGGYGARILAWIWWAIAYFLGSDFYRRSDVSLKQGCPQIESESVSLLGQSSLTLAILPGIWNWGSTVIAWMRRTFGRWAVGTKLSLSQDTRSLKRDTTVAIASFTPSPESSDCQNRPVGFQVIASYPATAAVTVAMSTGMSTTWLEVPATVVGYERSLLVRLLMAVDWVFVQLERLWAEIWQRVKRLFA